MNSNAKRAVAKGNIGYAAPLRQSYKQKGIPKFIRDSFFRGVMPLP